MVTTRRDTAIPDPKHPVCQRWRRSSGRRFPRCCWACARRSQRCDIARAKKINRTYAGAILRLTPLAPEIVAAIVEGRQPVDMTLPVLMKPFAVVWDG